MMVDGKFIMRHRNIPTADETSVIAEADKVGKRIWNQGAGNRRMPIPRLSRQR
jgi:hypothetical protein